MKLKQIPKGYGKLIYTLDQYKCGICHGKTFLKRPGFVIADSCWNCCGNGYIFSEQAFILDTLRVYENEKSKRL